MNSELFTIFRNIAFFFATVMLLKYFIFLLLAPFYEVKEALRSKRVYKKLKLKGKSELKQHKISVVVPAWNEEVGLLKTIKSVLRSAYSNYELVVINDGSTDHSDLLMRRFLEHYPKLRGKIRYYYKENGGKGEALNFGIAKAAGEIILTVDADSALHKNALKNINKYFNDDKVDAVVGNVIVSKNKSIIGLLQQLEYQFGFYFKRAHAVLNAEYIFGGACSAYRKSAIFEVIGMFDTENKTEDIEMSMRIRFFGHHCAYGEDVVCYTEGASTIAGLLSQRLRWKKGRFDTFIKYRRMFYSVNRRHNWFLTFFILPFSVLAEIQLLLEPISLTLLVAYSFITNDYVSLMLSSLFVFVVYLVNTFFTHQKTQLRTILLFPFTWPLFYFLVWIEYVALIRSMHMVVRGEDVEWQNWERQGVQE